MVLGAGYIPTPRPRPFFKKKKMADHLDFRLKKTCSLSLVIERFSVECRKYLDNYFGFGFGFITV